MSNFTFCQENSIISEAIYLSSPFCDARPTGVEIDLLVIHCISLPPNEYGGGNVQKLFTNQLDLDAHPYYRTIPSTQVSSHLFIERDGQLYQFVPFNQRAWHAGVSQFEGRPRCNDFSIGIELEGTENEPYTQAQYATLTQCASLILNQYPKINQNRIVGHSDIAPGRKTDPGPSFNWQYFKQELKSA